MFEFGGGLGRCRPPYKSLTTEKNIGTLILTSLLWGPPGAVMEMDSVVSSNHLTLERGRNNEIHRNYSPVLFSFPSFFIFSKNKSATGPGVNENTPGCDVLLPDIPRTVHI